MEKIEYLKPVLFLDDALLTFSRNVNNNNRCWGCENPHAVHDVSFI
jgi:hypothetical protein